MISYRCSKNDLQSANEYRTALGDGIQYQGQLFDGDVSKPWNELD